MKITLITVTYNSSKIIKKFLDQNQINLFFEVIVIDNASNDNTNKIIEKNFPNVILIKNEKNLGYGSALNIGATKSKSNYVLFINPDTFFSEVFFSRLETAIHRKKNFLCLVPRIIERKYQQKNDLNSESYFYDPDIYGSCFLINLDKFKSKKIFDEKIFLFFEDDDLMRRIKKTTKDPIGISDCILYFDRGESSAGLQIQKIKNWHFGWSYGYFHKKYSSKDSFDILKKDFIFKCLKNFFKYSISFNFSRSFYYFFRLRGFFAFLKGVDGKKIGNIGPF